MRMVMELSKRFFRDEKAAEVTELGIVLALIAGAGQFWQTRMLSRTRPQVKGKDSKDEDTMAIMNKQMMYIFPIVTVVIGATLPAGLTLYWLVSTLLMVAQQYVAFRGTGSGAPPVIEGEVVSST